MQSKGPSRNLRTNQNEKKENLNYTYTIISAIAGLVVGAVIGYFVMDNIVSGLMIFCGVGIVVGSLVDSALNKKRKAKKTETAQKK